MASHLCWPVGVMTNWCVTMRMVDSICLQPTLSSSTGPAHGAGVEDRILHEIHATGGDIHRICDRFGLTIDTALHYAITLGHPDLAGGDTVGSRTHDPR